MSVTRPRPRPIVVSHGPRKKVDFEPLPNVGNLSPDLQPNTPPVFQRPTSQNVLKIGKYLLFDHPEGNDVYSAVNSITGEKYVCKVSALLFSYLCIWLHNTVIQSSFLIGWC